MEQDRQDKAPEPGADAAPAAAAVAPERVKARDEAKAKVKGKGKEWAAGRVPDEAPEKARAVKAAAPPKRKPGTALKIQKPGVSPSVWSMWVHVRGFRPHSQSHCI